MFFFDTTPTGRILSRFSRDIHTIDHEIADAVDIFVFIVFQLSVVILTIVLITPFCKSLVSRFANRLVNSFPYLSSLSNPNHHESQSKLLAVAISLPFLGLLYITAMNYFRQVSREVKRLESIAR